MKVRVPDPLLLLVLGAGLFAGCSGGGSAGPNPPPVSPDPVNEGSFSLEAFGYQDPRPASYQPLSREITTLVELHELAVLDPTGQGNSFILDPNDPDPTGAPTTTGLVPVDAIDFAVGQIDGDVDQELLAIDTLGVVLVSEPNGSWRELAVPVGYEVVATGDVDGDRLDEIVLLGGLNTSEVLIRVYDDEGNACAPLHSSSWSLTHTVSTIDARLADVDGDGRDEIAVLTWRKDGDEHRIHLTVRDDHDAQFADLGERDLTPWRDQRHMWPGTVGLPCPGEWPGGGTTRFRQMCVTPRILVGDFDLQHAGQEICVAYVRRWTYAQGYNYAQGYTLHCELWAPIEGTLQMPQARNVFLGLVDHYTWLPGDADMTALDPAIIAADLDGNRFDELVFVHRYPTGEQAFACTSVPKLQDSPLAVYVVLLDGTESRWTRPEWISTLPGSLCPLDAHVSSLFPSPALTKTEVRLAVGDSDANGRDEVYVSTGFEGSSNLVRVNAVESGGDWSLEAGSAEALASPVSPIVAMGDFDGDNLAVRYTGHRELALGDPLPIVLVAAPPTKSDISQNYDASSTSYGFEQGAARSYGVSAGITASVSAGISVSDPWGIASASAKVTLGREFEATETTTIHKSETQTFTGSNQHDVIVFQGTLYSCYEYEVIDDDPQHSEYLRLNVPVAAHVYKWTVDFYNATVAPEYAIDPSILGHSVGDPASYMRQQQALDLATSYVGWASDQEATVGQGNGSNAIGITLTSENANEKTRSWSVTAECRYSLFGVSVGSSVGVTGSDIYTISMTQGTHYEGVVGDIANPTEYADWFYSFGLLAYNRGVLCDANNQPTGLEPGVLPFQVLTYWTTPTGPGY